jgi:hypothetical protein
MNPVEWILPLLSANGLLGGRTTFCPYADEPQVGQRHHDVERKREYYHIIIFPEKKLNFTSRKEEDKRQP